MNRIIQKNWNNAGQVGVYVDSHLIMEDGGVIYMSTFGTTMAMKAITAQLISNRGGIVIETENGFLKGEYGEPVSLKRGTGQLKILTRTIKMGVVHRIFYADNLFRPWKYDRERTFIAYGGSESEIRSRVFSVADKVSDTPLKSTWRDWLWDTLITEDWAWPESGVISGGLENMAQFKYHRLFVVPDDEWIEERIKQDLDFLKAA